MKQVLLEKPYYLLASVILALIFFLLLNHSSAASSQRQSNILPLPQAAVANANAYQPVPATEVVAGEFLDVDLPDDLKVQKYGELNDDDLNYSVLLAQYRDRDEAELALQLLAQQDSQVSLVVVSDRTGKLSYRLQLGHYSKPAEANFALADIKRMFPDALRIIKY